MKIKIRNTGVPTVEVRQSEQIPLAESARIIDGIAEWLKQVPGDGVVEQLTIAFTVPVAAAKAAK